MVMQRMSKTGGGRGGERGSDPLRKRAGAYLAGLRKDAGLTQMSMATAIGVEYYTFVSQVETGYTTLPSDKIAVWARACSADVSEVAKKVLSYYDPAMHDALYGKR